MALGLYGIRAVYGTTVRQAMEKDHVMVLVELQKPCDGLGGTTKAM